MIGRLDARRMAGDSDHRFTHIDKLLLALPEADREEAARAAGDAVPGYREAERRCARARSVAARRLAQGRPLTGWGLRSGDHLLFVGDSVTDDWCSWAGLMTTVAAEGTRGLELVVTDISVSGYTSVEAARRLAETRLASAPTWAFIALGTNDALRLKADPERTFVPLDETTRRLRQVALLARAPARRTVWLSPGRADAEAFQASDPGGPWTVRDGDLVAIAKRIADLPGVHVDVRAALNGDGLLGPDGLHPSPAGQLAIAEAVVDAMAGR
jgi:lysophospholipase L1-like esterase